MPPRNKLPSVLTVIRKLAFWNAVGNVGPSGTGSATVETDFSGRKVECCVTAYKCDGGFRSTAKWFVGGRFVREARLNEVLS